MIFWKTEADMNIGELQYTFSGLFLSIRIVELYIIFDTTLILHGDIHYNFSWIYLHIWGFINKCLRTVVNHETVSDNQNTDYWKCQSGHIIRAKSLKNLYRNRFGTSLSVPFTLILELIGRAVHHHALNELNTQTCTCTHTPLLLLQ